MTEQLLFNKYAASLMSTVMLFIKKKRLIYKLSVILHSKSLWFLITCYNQILQIKNNLMENE